MTRRAEKELLRAQIRARRRAMDPSWRALASRAVFLRLEALPVFQRARCIQAYVALRHEVDTQVLIPRLLQQGRRVAVPRVESSHEMRQYFIQDFSDLQAGTLGILEPRPDSSRRVTAESFDLVLVPGLAFDRAGNRLGAGKGYYDRFLAGIKAPKIALAFAFQIVEQVPIEPHDQRVDMIVTENDVISCC